VRRLNTAQLPYNPDCYLAHDVGVEDAGRNEKMDHSRRALSEQIGVIWNHHCLSDEVDVEFTRIHGLMILQLCEHILIERGDGVASKHPGGMDPLFDIKSGIVPPRGVSLELRR
jgi:hypothetical protein